ncbi:hypothetical protein BV25DRAFT_1819884 [Artomyces pyxidatus]|uniref:Uncharacterized protein n=1 Tax=Artomyces pyxidatus TaxID=48021 RepID=A0ACB8TED3_9AGAM|nr:hypothetical protein BV25DRAFT_1819884 [Artomyces pyxidatus]
MSTSVTTTASPVETSVTGSRDPPSTPFFSSGASPPIIVGFVAIGAFALGVITLCAWRRITGRDLLRVPQTRLTRLAGRLDLAGKPQIYEVVVDHASAEYMKWEDVVPFAAAVLQRPKLKDQPARPHAARGGPRQKAKEAQHDDAHLQIAVLLAMPSRSRPHGQTDHEPIPGTSADTENTDELAIGLLEVPWTKEPDQRPLARYPFG